jgi:hypothetical protein
MIRYNPADPNDIRTNAGFNLGFFIVPIFLGGFGILLTGRGVVIFALSR